MNNTKTKIKIMRQDKTDALEDFERLVQDEFDALAEKNEVLGGPFCFPCISSTWAMCVVIQWMELMPEKTPIN